MLSVTSYASLDIHVIKGVKWRMRWKYFLAKKSEREREKKNTSTRCQTRLLAWNEDQALYGVRNMIRPWSGLPGIRRGHWHVTWRTWMDIIIRAWYHVMTSRRLNPGLMTCWLTSSHGNANTRLVVTACAFIFTVYFSAYAKKLMSYNGFMA